MSYNHLLSEGDVFYDAWILATSNDAKIKKAKLINFKFDSVTSVFAQEIRNIPLKVEAFLFYGITQIFYLKCHYLHNDCKNAIKNISAYWINKKLAQKELATQRKKDLAIDETTYETVTFDETQTEENNLLSTSMLVDEPSRKRKRTLEKNQRLLLRQKSRLAKSLQVTASPTSQIRIRSINDGQIAGTSSISRRQQEVPEQHQELDQEPPLQQQMEVSVENESETVYLPQNIPEVILHDDDNQMETRNETELLELRVDDQRLEHSRSEIEISGLNANELPHQFDSIIHTNENLVISSFEEPAAKRSCLSINEGAQLAVEQREIEPQQQIENEMEVEETVVNNQQIRQIKKGGAKASRRTAQTDGVVNNNNLKKMKKKRSRRKQKIYKERQRILHFKNGLFANILMENVCLLEDETERMRPSLDFLDSLMGSKNTYDFFNTVNEKLNNVKFTPAKIIVEETENLFASTFASASKRKRGSNCALQDIQSQQQQFLNSNSMQVLDQTNVTVDHAASILIQPDEQMGNSLLLDNNSLQCFNQSENILANVEPEFSTLTNENLNDTNKQIGNVEPLIETDRTNERFGIGELSYVNDSLLGYNETNIDNISILHHRITEDKSEKFFDDELKPIIKESRNNQIKFSDLKKGKSRFNVCMTFNYLLYLKKNKKIDLKQRDSKSDIEVILINPF